MKRRTLVLVVAGSAIVVAAALLLLVVGTRRHHDPRDARLLPPSAPVRAFMGPVTDGAKLNRGAVVHVYDLWLGAIPVILETAQGHRCGALVLKREPQGTQGVANTEGLSVFFGNGGKPTVEEEAEVARAFAQALADREREAPPPPPLLTLSERHKLEGGSRLAFPLD
jgi:hypothetical protein